MHLYFTLKFTIWMASLLLMNVPHSTDSAKILGIFPVPAKSHFNFNKQIMYSLIKAGHQVTFVSPFQEPNPPANFTYIVPKETTVSHSANGGVPDIMSISVAQQMYLYRPRHFQFTSDLMKTPEIQNFLKSNLKTYDVLFVELLTAYECFLPLAEKFNIPVIGTLSYRPWMHTAEVFGTLHPSAIPSLWLPTKKKMGFLERFWNAFENLYAHLLLKYIWESAMTDFFQEYFPDYNFQRHRAISVLFCSNHASWYSTPLIPKIIDVSGIHLTPIKPLPHVFEKFINESENGVILFSLGSIIRSRSVGAKLRSVFRETFRCLQQRVIWKFEENIEDISENVLIREWIPQRDILAHKNVKVFITHTGINGVYEAIDAGVPLVSIPLCMDQISNAGLIEDIGVGIRLDIKTLTKEILLNAINDVMHDERYSKKMQKLSAEFKDRPMSPQESVVYWTEYVLKHNGTQHLQPMSTEIPLYQYLLLDIIIFIILFVLTVSFILSLIYKVSGKILKKVKKLMH